MTMLISSPHMGRAQAVMCYMTAGVMILIHTHVLLCVPRLCPRSEQGSCQLYLRPDQSAATYSGSISIQSLLVACAIIAVHTVMTDAHHTPACEQPATCHCCNNAHVAEQGYHGCPTCSNKCMQPACLQNSFEYNACLTEDSSSPSAVI
jgi:hypothetical protein